MKFCWQECKQNWARGGARSVFFQHSMEPNSNTRQRQQPKQINVTSLTLTEEVCFCCFYYLLITLRYRYHFFPVRNSLIFNLIISSEFLHIYCPVFLVGPSLMNSWRLSMAECPHTCSKTHVVVTTIPSLFNSPVEIIFEINKLSMTRLYFSFTFFLFNGEITLFSCSVRLWRYWLLYVFSYASVSSQVIVYSLLSFLAAPPMFLCLFFFSFCFAVCIFCASQCAAAIARVRHTSIYLALACT